MQRFQLLAVLAFAFLASPALAGDYGPVERVQIPGIGAVDYQHLFTETSQPGESMDAFALRLGPRLRQFSDETGFEACGVLATDGERFGVVVGSNRSHIACANFHSKVPAGMRATGQTIHSHGKERGVRANRNDLALNGEIGHGQGGIRRVAGQTLDAFSATDYDGGPGYLAAPQGVVLHQHGKGTSRRVAAD